MEAVRIRQRGAEDFASYYENLCALEGTCPVASIRAGAREGLLTCFVYRIQRPDWHPLLAALRINKALHTVVFYDKWESRVCPKARRLETGRCNTVLQPAGKKVDREVTSNITRSVRECLCASHNVRSLVFEGVQLSSRDCKLLAKGLQTNSSLTHLSFKGSGIGDKGAEVVCGAVKNSAHLEWLDLSVCNISWQGAGMVAALIKHQCLCRQSLAWKDSLRYRQPQLGKMPGLRRVTLNINTEIGDRGAGELADILRDDVCLKALDLQSCGVSTEGAQGLHETLKYNTCLIVLDLRANPLIDDDVIDAIRDQLSINVAAMDKSEESYVWLDVELERIVREFSQTHASRNRTKPGGHLTAREGVPRPLRGRKKVLGGRWRRGSIDSLVGVARRRGIPWRTAARTAHRWRGLMAGKSSWVHPEVLGSPALAELRHQDVSASGSPHDSPSREKEEGEDGVTAIRRIEEVDRKKAELQVGRHQDSGVIVVSAEEFRQLKEEIAVCHRRLSEEREEAKARVLKLESENRKLKEQLCSLRRGTTPSKCLPPGTVLVDEQALDTIESTFKQFSTFLDLLHAKGFGELCELLDKPPLS